jgi:glycerol-3-phosphate dehydrogenase
VLALAAERGELAQPIVAGNPDLLAEVALAARREQARSIGDVLFRRTRLALLAGREIGSEPPERGAGDAAPVRRVGETMARELGWDAVRLARELERYTEEARLEGILAGPDAGAGRAITERQPGTAPAHAASVERAP